MKIFKYIFFFIFAFSLCGCQKASLDTEYEYLVIPHESQKFSVDLDGDEVKESIWFELTDDAVEIYVNDKNMVIPISTKNTDADITQFHEAPQLHLIGAKQDVKTILLSTVWNTNKVGTSVELYSFKYLDGKLEMESDTNDRTKTVDYIIERYKDETIIIDIPKYLLNLQIPVDQTFYHEFLSKNLEGQFEEIAEVMYYIKDYNDDNKPEIIIEKIVSTGAVEWLPFRTIFEIYEMQDGK